MTGYFRRLAGRTGLLGEPRSSAAPTIAPLERETVTEVTAPAAASPLHPAPAPAARPLPGVAVAPTEPFAAARPFRQPSQEPMPFPEHRTADAASPEMNARAPATPFQPAVDTTPAVQHAEKPEVGVVASAAVQVRESSPMEAAASDRVPEATASSAHTSVGTRADTNQQSVPQAPASRPADEPFAATARRTSAGEPADAPPGLTRAPEAARSSRDVEPFPAPRDPSTAPAPASVPAASRSLAPTRVAPSPRPAVAAPAPTVRIGTVHVEVRAPQPVAPQQQPARPARSAPQAPALRRYYLREW